MAKKQEIVDHKDPMNKLPKEAQEKLKKII